MRIVIGCLCVIVYACGFFPVAPARTLTHVHILYVSDNGFVFKVGSTRQYRAEARFSDNGTEDVTSLADWRAPNARIATVSAGLVRGVGPGAIEISATYQGMTASSNVRVDP